MNECEWLPTVISTVISIVAGGLVGWGVAYFYDRKQNKEMLFHKKQRLFERIDLYFIIFINDKVKLQEALIRLGYIIQGEKFYTTDFSLDMQNILFLKNISQDRLIKEIHLIFERHYGIDADEWS